MSDRRPTRLFRSFLLALIPLIVFATPTKQAGESIQLEVVSTKTNYHGSSPQVFKYTEVMFTRVSGKRLVFVCEQRGDECPLMQDGKTYSADRVGNFIYLSMSSPDGKKSMPVKYKETGTW
jgi:hypothetical protein